MRYAREALAIVAVAAACGTASAAPVSAIERSVSQADIVILAEAGSIAKTSRRPVLWSFRVDDMMKGDGGSGEIKVDMEKAPVGLWPKSGEKTILCLSSKGGGVYQLASYYKSILGVGDAQAVRDAVKTTFVASTGDTTPNITKPIPHIGPVGPGSTPRVDIPTESIAEADTILVGALSGVRPNGRTTKGIFKVEDSFMGYGGFVEPITVNISGRAPKSGRYVLFLRGSLRDGTFSTVSGRSIVPVASPADVAKLKSAVRAAIPAGKGKRLATIQATLAEWESSWNARDLARCIRCYSSASRLRRQYESGEQGRRSLEQQMKNFPGKVSLTLQRIVLLPSEGQRAADATVMLRLSAPGIEDRRSATMSLVFEDGEWLVLNEGF